MRGLRMRDYLLARGAEQGCCEPAHRAVVPQNGLNMPRLYQTKVWQLQIPDTWTVEDGCGQELVTFFRPDGIGILKVLMADQQSSHQTGGGEDFRGRLPGKTWALTHGASFSRTWALSCRGRKLYVRYSCAAHNAESERLEVDEIVASISESDSQAA